jgi:hypothetical protein
MCALTLLLLPTPATHVCTQTRWYSFQFLVMELLEEMHELYHCIRDTLTRLPHGL